MITRVSDFDTAVMVNHRYFLSVARLDIIFLGQSPFSEKIFKLQKSATKSFRGMLVD